MVLSARNPDRRGAQRVGEELTPTMKLRRKPIAERYAAEIDELYAAARA